MAPLNQEIRIRRNVSVPVNILERLGFSTLALVLRREKAWDWDWDSSLDGEGTME
jgi:hypothetical protein